MTTETEQHAAGVRWAIRPLVDCALRHTDPERLTAVAQVFADAAAQIRAAAKQAAKAA